MSTSTEILEHRRSLSDADLDAVALIELRDYYSMTIYAQRNAIHHTSRITKQAMFDRGRGERWDELVAIVKGERK